MIKLTATQKEIEELAPRVPSLTPSQIEWAERTYPYFQWIKCTDTEVCCPNCKEKVHFGQLKGKKGRSDIEHDMYCPHCGAKIHVRSYDTGYCAPKNRKRQCAQEYFFEVLNVVGDWQVTRLIYMRRYCYIRKDNTPWEYYECCQAWNNPTTKNTYFRALPKKFMPRWCYNPYSLYTWGLEENADEETFHRYVDIANVLSPRKVNGANYFDTSHIAPKPQIHKQYKRMGLTYGFLQKDVVRSAIGWFECFGGKNYKPMWETLIKAKEYELMRGIGHRWRKEVEFYFNAWKIAKRHHYKIKNVEEWLDLLDLLADAHMDCRNPRYICPTNVHELHQNLLVQSEKEKERRRDKERLQEALKYSKEYAERIAKYLDMDIHDETLHIVVLPNIKAFKDEADHLCHCVFRSRYYLHTDSLILSARDAKGKRWETIEVSLRDFTIIQAYGYGDNHTEKHKEILNLVESNMWQIRDRYAKAS